MNLCLPAGARKAGVMARGAAARRRCSTCGPCRARSGAGRGAAPPATPDPAGWYASPYKVFDNLYWLGTRQHSSWALMTSAGIILIDTNFACRLARNYRWNDCWV